MIILLTGVPGTGKDTVAEELSRKGFDWISSGKIVQQRKLWTRMEGRAKVVKLKQLETEVRKQIAKARRLKKKTVVEGHLVCEMRLSCDIGIILRTNPRVLEKRLRGRKYPESKIHENIECELIDYCTQLAEKNWKARKGIFEIETSGTIPAAFKKVGLVVSGKERKFHAGWVDWSKYLKHF